MLLYFPCVGGRVDPLFDSELDDSVDDFFRDVVVSKRKKERSEALKMKERDH